MGKKEEIEERKKKEKIRQLRKGPDLEQFLEGRKSADGRYMSISTFSFLPTITTFLPK